MLLIQLEPRWCPLLSQGHGVTGGPALPPPARAAFLADLLRALHLQQPLVLVTPSMSGTYALPWLTEHAAELAGWVAVAPVGLRGWQPPAAQSQVGAGGVGKGRHLRLQACRPAGQAAAACNLQPENQAANQRVDSAAPPSRLPCSSRCWLFMAAGTA